MITALLSDIHGNLEALDAVLEECYKRGVEQFFILGDLVDYGANSVEVVRRIITLCDEYEVCIIKGNHDEAIIKDDCSEFRTSHSKKSFEVTKEEIYSDQESLNFLRSLHTRCFYYTEEGTEVSLVHGSDKDWLWGSYSPVVPYEVLVTDKVIRKGHSVIMCGHTHIPGLFIRNKDVIINPGSVGQPRNGDPRAQFDIFDEDWFDSKSQFKHIKVKYDIDSAADKIIKSGRPQFLANRLYLGI